MSSKPVLYHLQNSQSLRILWLLKFVNAEYDLILIARKESRNYPELEDAHPLGKSPVLKVDNHIFAESRLCMEQIKTRYASGRLDKTGEEKMRDDYFSEFATATLTFGVMNVLLFDLVGLRSPWLIRPLLRPVMNLIVKKLTEELIKPLKLMEDSLCQERPYFGGELIGLSDFMMSWPMDLGVARAYIILDHFPKLSAWRNKCRAMATYQEAVKETIIYDPKLFE